MVDKLFEKDHLNGEWHTKYAHIFSYFENRNKKQYILDLCNKMLADDTIVYICCSGGPDSMFLSFLLIRYRHYVKGLSLSITKILHVNHNTSLSDISLQKIVFSSFSPFFDIKSVVFEKGLFSETHLRKMRWEFFTNTIQNPFLSGQSVCLCLGHNLDDRIENSFLHFDRGTHIRGIVNMQWSQQKNVFQGDKSFTYKCFRPLLSFSKKDIEKWCDLSCIPYGEDTHNFDLTQKRIQYRVLIQQLPKQQQQQLYKERSFVYKQLEKEVVSDTRRQKLSPPDIWLIDGLYKTRIPASLKELVDLFLHIQQFNNMSTVRLEEVMKWFKKKQGTLYLSGWWFLCAYDELYIVKQQLKSKFREEKHLIKQPISKDQSVYTIGGYVRTLDPGKFTGSDITFPSATDCVGTTPYNKRAAKKHIPFFWRSALPIIKKNNKVIAVLPSSLRPWKI